MGKRQELLEIAKDSVLCAKRDLGKKKETANNFKEEMMKNLDGVEARIEKMLNTKSEEELTAKFDVLKGKFSSYEISRKAHSETYSKIYY